MKFSYNLRVTNICFRLSYTALRLLIVGMIGYSHADSQILQTSSPELRLRNVVLTGETNPDTKLEVYIWPQRNNQVELKKLLNDIYTIGNPNYRHFLSKDEYAKRFSPPDSEIKAITQYFASKGFNIGIVPDNHAYIPLSGSVAQFSQEFQIKINNYNNAGKQSYSNDRPISINSEVANSISNVTGLDNFQLVKRNTSSTKMQPQSGNVPSAYMPQILKKAYGVDKLPNNITGSGQTIAIVDAYDDPNVESDLSVFSNRYALPVCSTTNGCFSKLNQNGAVSPLPEYDKGWTTEISLDTQSTHSLATGAKIILVEADDASNQNLFTAINTIVGNQLANIISNSWGEPEYPDSPLEMILEEAALKGISVNFSSGDDGDMKVSTQSPNPTIQYPASSPNATAVGATTLLMTSDGRYKNETGWAWPWEDIGSTGGLSQYYTAATWQQQTISSATAGGYGTVGVQRAVPDISMLGDPNTGLIIYNSNESSPWFQEGGTSLSCPLFSALLALANQSLQNNNLPQVGLAAATIYSMNFSVHQGTAPITNIVAPKNTISSVLSAGPGWNDITGLGTPYAPTFIQWLINNGK